ncbi:GntR family transcriptional regulator [Marinivivus vitaminiproducens]|uniref:GntR family transcriptional regulator n=1 Tax=Marinivivus vitaminiproducens TaxID=3035935 RepID=UPI0027A5DD80|nr:GntR family transcriptional regulator [Geminicoccaceae bacterium SCSIO 64248]
MASRLPSRRSAEPIVRPEGLNDVVLRRLREDIIDDVFALGEKLSEYLIAEHYGVTRAPVRTAFRHLQAEGLLQIQPQRGAFVFNPAPAEIRALCELRTALEHEAVALAMARNRPGIVARLRALLGAMAACVANADQPAYQKLDDAFHLAIHEMADSPLLLETYRSAVSGRCAALRIRLSRHPGHLQASIREHRAITADIEAGDLDSVQARLRGHIENTQSFYAGLLDHRPDPT